MSDNCLRSKRKSIHKNAHYKSLSNRHYYCFYLGQGTVYQGLTGLWSVGGFLILYPRTFLVVLPILFPVAPLPLGIAMDQSQSPEFPLLAITKPQAPAAATKS